MKTLAISIFCFFLFIVPVSAHPVHVSITQIEIIQDSKQLNYSIKVFAEDFESIINYKYNTFLEFGERIRMTTKEQDAITDYLSRNFCIMANSDTLAAKFVSWKQDEEAVWFSFTAVSGKEIVELNIINKLLTEFYTDQQNLVIVKWGNQEKGLQFNKRKQEEKISL